MYLCFSDCYERPLLIRDPARIYEDLNGVKEAHRSHEEELSRLEEVKKALKALASLAPDSLAGELYERIERAEEENEALYQKYEAKREELLEALLLLGRYRGEEGFYDGL